MAVFACGGGAINLGNLSEDQIAYIPFNTYGAAGNSVTVTNLANTDVHIHKDNGLTQRNNAAGVTVSIDFDGITGNHMIVIDTSENTVAGFWTVGHDYFVRVEGITVDGQTINMFLAMFSIQNRYLRPKKILGGVQRP